MTALTLPAPHTANQRLKDGFGLTLALSLVAATVLHALFFSLWPTMRAASWAAAAGPTTQVVQVATTTLPPAPKSIPVPARPVISSAAPPQATLDLPGWNDVVKLPLPPAPKAASEAGDNTWTGPVTVQPSIANPEALRSALERAYPGLLRDAGIGGTVGLLVRIDTHGRVLEAKIERSSGYRALDAAALKVSGMLRFHPALNRDTPVSVWVSIPVTFQVHEGGSLALEARPGSR
jgi:TonB family protein